jgi:hypothetical protein
MIGPSSPLQLVDSYLLAVQADPVSHDVILTFRAPSGEHEFGLRARAVEYLIINEFSIQNIVHELRVFGKTSAPDDVRELLTLLMFDEAHVAAGLEPILIAELDEHTASVLREQKVLTEIEPVIGASLLMLSGPIEWIGLSGNR